MTNTDPTPAPGANMYLPKEVSQADVIAIQKREIALNYALEFVKITQTPAQDSEVVSYAKTFEDYLAGN